MDEQIEPWVEQYMRLRRAYDSYPSQFPSIRRDQITFLEKAVAPADNGHVYISGRRLGKVHDDQLRVAGMNIYRRNREKLDELTDRLSKWRPSVDNSFALLYLLHEMDLKRESGRIGDVADAVDEKIAKLSKGRQKEVLGKYDFTMSEEFWSGYNTTAPDVQRQTQQMLK